MSEVLFWSSFTCIVYAYLGYPLLLLIVSIFRYRPVHRSPIEPPVTIIISAHNEEILIGQKLENTLSLEYPRSKLQILVASDCSLDRTHEIVLSYRPRGVELVATHERKGKEFAQHEAIKRASGEILVFTDTSIMLERNALKTIVSNFNDRSVGCVSCEDSLTVGTRINAEPLYIKYDMWIRRMESKVGSPVGLSGYFFAVRKGLCHDWSDRLASDFLLLLSVVQRGYRGVSDSNTLGYYKTVGSLDKEFRRKVRTVVRGITVLMCSLDVLNPIKYGLFTIQVISHKLLKWLVPLFLILLILTNLLLISDSPFYQIMGISQLLFYLTALLGITVQRLNEWFPVRVASFLVVSNFSIAVAWLKYLKGERIVFWEPSTRQR